MAKMVYTQEEKEYMEQTFGKFFDDSDAYGSKVKEYRKAKSLGMTVPEWQKAQREANKKATLQAKIKRYERRIEEMKKELERL